MAITVPVRELQDIIVGALGAPEAWLNQLVGFDSIPGDMPVGTSKVTYLTEPTGYTVSKSDTTNRADGGASSTATITTVQKNYPIKFYDHEVARITDVSLGNIARRTAHAVLKEAGTAIIDAISDDVITQTHEIYETDTSRNNFATGGVAAVEAANAAVLNAAISDIASISETPWILLHPRSWGNIRSYSRATTAAPMIDGPRRLLFDGIPVYSSQKSGTAAKWGAAAKPTAIVGCGDSLGFAWQTFNLSDEWTRIAGVMTLEFNITYSYAIISEAELLSEVRNFDVT